jgi:hypothetical protein
MKLTKDEQTQALYETASRRDAAVRRSRDMRRAVGVVALTSVVLIGTGLSQQVWTMSAVGAALVLGNLCVVWALRKRIRK